MAQELYNFIESEDPKDLAVFCREAARLREQDVEQFSNLSNVFMSGRKVGKIPTGSSDVAATDRIGDFNYDANYLYLCVDNSGATWRRVTLGSW